MGILMSVYICEYFLITVLKYAKFSSARNCLVNISFIPESAWFNVKCLLKINQSHSHKIILTTTEQKYHKYYTSHHGAEMWTSEAENMNVSHSCKINTGAWWCLLACLSFLSTFFLYNHRLYTYPQFCTHHIVTVFWEK